MVTLLLVLALPLFTCHVFMDHSKGASVPASIGAHSDDPITEGT